MASVSHFSRLAAIALLNYADDEGYFIYNHHVIRGEVFPFEEDSKNVLRAVEELSSIGFLVLGTTSEGKRVGWIPNFLNHQRIDKAQTSEIAGLEIIWSDSKNIPRTFQERSRLETEEETEEETETKPDRKSEAERIYALYPRKEARGKAIAAISKALRKTSAETLIEAVTAFAAAKKGVETRFIPHPASWFNGERWLDDRSGWRDNSRNGPPQPPQPPQIAYTPGEMTPELLEAARRL